MNSLDEKESKRQTDRRVLLILFLLKKYFPIAFIKQCLFDKSSILSDLLYFIQR